MAHTDAAVAVETMDAVDSTNEHLLQKAQRPEKRFVVCCAERQRRGRGRRGRRWLSPANGNVYLSVLTPRMPQSMAWLSLMSAVAVARQLDHLGAPRIGVKWPNDVFYDGRLKLAGLLIESRRRRCVIGLGLNIHSPVSAAAARWTALDEITDHPYDRQMLSGQLSAALINAFRQTAQSSLAQLMASWREYDMLRGRSLSVVTSTGATERGVAAGVDAQGRLRLDQGHGRRRAFAEVKALSLSDAADAQPT